MVVVLGLPQALAVKMFEHGSKAVQVVVRVKAPEAVLYPLTRI
jgi:hypothetical protein